VLVGVWRRVGADPVAHTIANGPRASGVYATFAPGGRSLTVLDQDGHAVRVFAGGAGLVAATREGSEGAPVWVVTGTDEAGVERAAGAFDEATLRERFAVAATAAGTLPAPVPLPR
jgi:hypothetical protein